MDEGETKNVSIDLATLVLDFSKHNSDEKERVARELYSSVYLEPGKDKGTHTLHDGESVVFFGNQFNHAFYTTNDSINFEDRKNTFAIERARRLKWIGPVIEGKVGNTECWEVSGRTSANRLYVVWKHNYIIWIEPRQGSGWRFSSAYDANPKYIRSKIKNGTKIWTSK